MKIIKVKLNKAEVNDKGFEEIRRPAKDTADSKGKRSREFWEDMGIEPTPENCYDYDGDKNIEIAVELDFKEHFDYYTVDFYFRADEFKFLEIDEQEDETVALLTLQDGTEYSVHEDSIEQLKAELEKLK